MKPRTARGEGKARRAYSAKPSRLPTPDGYWANQRPWWFEPTVDEDVVGGGVEAGPAFPQWAGEGFGGV